MEVGLSYAPERMLPRPRNDDQEYGFASLRRRFVAGGIDMACIAALSSMMFVFHVGLIDAVVPLWTIFGVSIALLVLPLWAFRQTGGMRLLGLRLISVGSHEPDLLDLLFREVIGRGFFVVGVVAAMLVAPALERFGFEAQRLSPTVESMLIVAAVANAVLAAAGHIRLFVSDDRRSAGDLFAGILVVDTRRAMITHLRLVLPCGEPDAPALDGRRLARRRRLARFALLETACFIVAVVSPLLVRLEPPRVDVAAISRNLTSTNMTIGDQ